MSALVIQLRQIPAQLIKFAKYQLNSVKVFLVEPNLFIKHDPPVELFHTPFADRVFPALKLSMFMLEWAQLSFFIRL